MEAAAAAPATPVVDVADDWAAYAARLQSRGRALGFGPAAAPEDAEMAASGPEPPEKRTRTVGSLELEAFVECGMMYEGLDKQDHMALEAFIGAVVAGPAAAAAGQPDLVAESVVYDARSGEELDLDLVRVGRLGELDQLSTRSIAKFPLRRLGVDVSRHGGSTSTGERTATRRCEAGLWPWSSTCTSETM